MNNEVAPTAQCPEMDYLEDLDLALFDASQMIAVSPKAYVFRIHGAIL